MDAWLGRSAIAAAPPVAAGRAAAKKRGGGAGAAQPVSVPVGPAVARMRGSHAAAPATAAPHPHPPSSSSSSVGSAKTAATATAVQTRLDGRMIVTEAAAVIPLLDTLRNNVAMLETGAPLASSSSSSSASASASSAASLLADSLSVIERLQRMAMAPEIIDSTRIGAIVFRAVKYRNAAGVSGSIDLGVATLNSAAQRLYDQLQKDAKEAIEKDAKAAAEAAKKKRPRDKNGNKGGDGGGDGEGEDERESGARKRRKALADDGEDDDADDGDADAGGADGDEEEAAARAAVDKADEAEFRKHLLLSAASSSSSGVVSHGNGAGLSKMRGAGLALVLQGTGSNGLDIDGELKEWQAAGLKL